MTLLRVGVVAFTFLASGCTSGSDFDWNQGENVLLEKRIEERSDGSVAMHFVSLVNAPGDELWKAFIDVENHDKFIEGVTESKLVKSTGGVTKIVDVTNRVIGRPNHARVEWTIDRDNKVIAFKTLEAELTDNSATYRVETSPDGKRAKITTDYLLRDKGGHPFPIHTLKQGVVDGYTAAVRSVKRRVLGDKPVASSD